jgi:Methylase involved in ubiquinone/menaquinone biosynthesis
VDASERQLALGSLQAEHGMDFPLVHADAEQVPYPDGSFDLALSEYGASSWCDPYRWLPEAARLLRPGGWLLFLVVSPILTICSFPDGSAEAGDRLVRQYFGMHEIETPAFGTTEFQLPYGQWVRALREAGFTLERLEELQGTGGGDHSVAVRERGVGPPLAVGVRLGGPQAHGLFRRTPAAPCTLGNR